MAQSRRSPQHRVFSPSISSPLQTRRKFPTRQSPPLRRRLPPPSRFASSTSHASNASIPSDLRPVLVPLHPNLRRLPSRLFSSKQDSVMRDVASSDFPPVVGVKRKRVASVNENTHHHGRPTRGSGTLKRLRSASGRYVDYAEDSDASSMEIDSPVCWPPSGDTDQEQEDEIVEDEDSTDDYLINSASARQLQRLRKDELIRLHEAAGFSEDAEMLTKSEIVEAIIAARDDITELPPSSPISRGNSSDYSSDGGNMAGDEETDVGGPRHPAINLKRRATVNDLGKATPRPMKGRSHSMGHLLEAPLSPPPTIRRKASARFSDEQFGRRRKSSNQSSPTTSATTSTVNQSPPAMRLRSRKVSASIQPITPVSDASSAPSNKLAGTQRRNGKGKQVEFIDDVELLHKTPSNKAAKERERARILEEESDLTDLSDLDELEGVPSTSKQQISPRRLRSKDRVRDQEAERTIPPLEFLRSSQTKRAKTREVAEEEEVVARKRRVTPMRKAKGKIKSLRESDLENAAEDGTVEENNDSLDDDETLNEEEAEDEDAVIADEDEGSEEAEEDEVDELVSSASATPPPPVHGRQTPVKRRLRPRHVESQPSSDGDDEDEGDEGDVDGEGEESVDGEEEEEEEAAIVAPRKLRNGKVVGDDDTAMDDEEDEEVEECAEDDDETPDIGEERGDDDDDDDESKGEMGSEEDDSAEVASVDLDAEGDTDEEEEEPMEEDVDLTIATTKTLVRMRRDDLVRLCEVRDLEPVGTKPQLAEALLQWRDRQTEFSSPSSAGTVRPTSNVRRRNKKATHTSSTQNTPPVLLREHVHQDEPRTPPISGNKKEPEPELELDLESLGLEDREIPPEKLQKLEKIGSGGFKDVFIGKFKGRKIAISEFRGQLSAMDIKELKLLGGFDHPNIVRFLGVSIPENTRETPVMIVSELCSNGDLFDYVRNVNPPSLHKVLVMMLDIARGLEYLHLRKPSVIHRDCKSSNILITAKGTAKIADFGLAKVKQSTRSMVRSLVGTVNWQAPELWHAHPKYNHKVDVFSCAMVYWEMLQWHLPNKKFPWEGMNEHAIYDIVGAKRQRPSTAGLRRHWCPEIVDLMEKMWAQDHTERPTMSEVVETLEEIISQR